MKFNLRTFGYELRRTIDPEWASYVDEIINLRDEIKTQAKKIKHMEKVVQIARDSLDEGHRDNCRV